MISFQLGELYELHLDKPKPAGRALSADASADDGTSSDAGCAGAIPGSSKIWSGVELARLLVPAYERADDTRNWQRRWKRCCQRRWMRRKSWSFLRRLAGLVRKLGDVENA